MLFLLAGLLFGSLADYLIHRLLGHGPGSTRSQSPLLGRHSQIHHTVFSGRRGMRAARGEARRSHIHLQFTAFLTLLATIAIVGGVLLPIIGGENTIFLMAGLLIALISYDVLHRLFHMALPSWTGKIPIFKQLRDWHFKHHEEPDAHFAVLLPLWDYLFFTHHGLQELEAPMPGEQQADRGGEPRSRPTTSMRALLSETIKAADAEVAEQSAPPKSRKERRKAAKTGSSERPKTGSSGRAAPRTGNRKVRKSSGWLNVLDKDDAVDVKVSAVKEEED